MLKYSEAPADTLRMSLEDTHDYGPAMQAAAAKHLEQVWEAFYKQDEADTDCIAVEIPSPAVGPFCGCNTCEIRETLAGAWPVIEAYFTSGAHLLQPVQVPVQ